MHLLEPETAGQCEGRMRSHDQNVSEPMQIGQNRGGQPLAKDAAKPIFPS
jgi:hypothetical protein